MPILENFEEFLRREFARLDGKKKIAFISDVADALKFLFDYHVVHRDMKLNNLLIDAAGRIILSDFGFALQTEDMKMHILPTGIGRQSTAFGSKNQTPQSASVKRSDFGRLQQTTIF